MDDLTQFIENSHNIDVIYLDFRKAFDTVPHQRLLNKLSAYGINGPLLKWISCFLLNRFQKDRVGEEYSKITPVGSGIPQGSVLGPLLFIIFINDLPENLECCCKIFADDTKLYGKTEDHRSLQRDIFKLLDWSNTWQLHFNTSKCKVLHIGKKNEGYKYYVSEQSSDVLEITENEKDIGVTFSTKLDFDLHINNIVNKANQMTGLIKRSFTYIDKDVFLTLYKSIVRPHLEYANVVWHPLYNRQLQSIEKVQRRATKIVKEIKNMSYSDRLKSLKLPSI